MRCREAIELIQEESALRSNSNNSPGRVRGHFLLFWWLISLSLPVLMLVWRPVEMQSSVLVYIGLWLFIVIGFVVFVRRWSFSAVLSQPFDILEIPVYLGLTSMFLIQAFGLAPYFDQKYLRLLPSTSYLPSGLLLTGTGLFSMLFGYALVSASYKRASVRPRPTFFVNPSLSLTFFTYVGLLFLRLFLIANGTGEMILNTAVVRLGGDGYQWIVYLIELRWFFMALVTLQVAAGRWPRWFLVFVLFIEGTLAVASGWSSLLPKIVLLTFGCLIYAKHTLPWRTLIPTGILVLAVIVFFVPVVRDLRGENISAGQITLPNIQQSIGVAWGRGVGTGWQLFSDLIIERQTVVAQTPAILLKLIPSTIPYLPAQDLLEAPIAFIPRAIWPSKPAYSNIGIWLTIRIFGQPESDSSSAVTMSGNAYMYGGWLVVVLGMFILGVVAALMYCWLAIPGLLSNQVGLLAVYAAVVIADFHLGEGDFVSQWQGLVQRSVVFLVMATILCTTTGARIPRFKKQVGHVPSEFSQ